MGNVIVCFFGELDAQLLEFPVQMGAFQPDLFGHTGDIASLPLQMEIEVDRVKILARLAQRQVERQRKFLFLSVDIQGGVLAIRFGLGERV